MSPVAPAMETTPEVVQEEPAAEPSPKFSTADYLKRLHQAFIDGVQSAKGISEAKDAIRKDRQRRRFKKHPRTQEKPE